MQLFSTDFHIFYLPQTILRMNRFKRQKKALDKIVQCLWHSKISVQHPTVFAQKPA
jgi:hypothetical protein